MSESLFEIQIVRGSLKFEAMENSDGQTSPRIQDPLQGLPLEVFRRTSSINVIRVNILLFGKSFQILRDACRKFCDHSRISWASSYREVTSGISSQDVEHQDFSSQVHTTIVSDQ